MLYDNWQVVDALVNLSLQAVFAVMILRRADAILAGRMLPPRVSAGATLAALRRGRLLFNYESFSFLFLVSAAIFQIMLVVDGRYREAPLAVFIIPVLGALFRFWTKDRPKNLTWEDILAANTLALAAIASAVIEGGNNLDFITWSIAALALAAPVILATEGKRWVRKVKRRK